MILLELSGFGVSTFFGVACKPRFSTRSVCVCRSVSLWLLECSRFGFSAWLKWLLCSSKLDVNVDHGEARWNPSLCPSSVL